MNLFGYAVLIALLPLVFGLDDSSEFTSEYIKNLKPDDFYDLLETAAGLIFVRFYLPYCPACEEFQEDWERVAIKLNGTCTMVDYNCDKDPDTCWFVGVGSFPEFGVFKNNKLIALYLDDDYSYRNLIDFIKKKEYLEKQQETKAKRARRIS